MNNIKFIDTNILIYALDVSSSFHDKARAFLVSALSNGGIYLTVQNLMELYAIVTNPKRVTSPLTQHEAVNILLYYINSKQVHIITPQQKTAQTIVNLLLKYKIKSSEIHDVHLAAILIDNHIRIIYTADTSVFKRLDLLTVNPFE